MNTGSLSQTASGCVECSSATELKSCQDGVLLNTSNLSKQLPDNLSCSILGILKAYERAICSPDTGDEQSSYESNLVEFLQQVEVALAAPVPALTDIIECLTSLLQTHAKLSPRTQAVVTQAAVNLACSHCASIEPACIARLIRAILSLSPTGPLQFSELDSTSTTATALERLSESCASAVAAEHQKEFLEGAINCVHTLARSFTAPDAWHTKLCTSFLSCIANLIPLPGQQPCIQQHCAALLDSLRVFWTFGLEKRLPKTSSEASLVSSTSESAAGSKYVPPWQRNKTAGHSKLSTRPTTSIADSSHSDSDTSIAPSRDSSCKVRISSLRALTLALRHHPAALHQVWDRLLPHSTQTPLPPLPGGRAAPTSLLGVLLNDPSVTARASAATALQTMMTGVKNVGFMRVARSSSAVSASTSARRPSRPRAFMPLSESMAAMLMSAHSAFAQSVQTETAGEVLPEVLKAATLLLQHTPYHNMQKDAARELLQALAACWNSNASAPEYRDSKGSWQRSSSAALSSPRSPRHEGVAIRCAVLTAFAAALQTPVAASVLTLSLTPPSNTQPDWEVAKVATGAAPKPPRVNERDDDAAPNKISFTDVLMQCALPSQAHAALQWEACSALRMLCSALVPVQRPTWQSISTLVNAHLQKVLGPASRAQSRSGKSNGGTSASLPEKVVNQAIRLAGDWMKVLLLQSGTPENSLAGTSYTSDTKAAATQHHTCTESRITNKDASVAATGFVQLITQCAAQAGVPVIRSAAFAAIAAAPPSLWVTLQSEQVQRLVVRVRCAATDDGVPATRAQAVNALQGIVVDVSSVAALGTELDEVVRALATACSDASASVRGASAAALAALCTTLRDVVHEVREDGIVESSKPEPTVAVALEQLTVGDEQSKGGVGCTANPVIRTGENVRDGVVVEGCLPTDVIGCGHVVGDLLQPQSWNALCEAALHVARGGDKVRAHGMRAIGCLYSLIPAQHTPILPELLSNNAGLQKLCDAHQQSSHLVNASTGGQELSTADGAAGNWPDWCSQAAKELCQSMKQGNAKCAWNACIATAQLFSRRKQLKDLVTDSDMRAVHAAVVEQLHCSNNFKVRIHAAHAVQVAGPSCVPAGAVQEVLSAVMHALRALGADDTSQRLQGHAVNSSSAGATSSETPKTASSSPTKMNRAEGVERGDDAPANFRYHAELTMRLTGVLVDFLAALHRGEAAALAGEVGWILEFLEDQIALWSVGSAPQDPSGGTAPPEPQASGFTRQSNGSPGDIEEVAVRGGRLQLLVPRACSNVLAAVSNLLELSAAADLSVVPHEAVLQRLHADMLAKGIGVHGK